MVPEIRPNFSGSHTFSLTATAKIGFALPAGMLLQSETKIEPDLRLTGAFHKCGHWSNSIDERIRGLP